MAKPYEMRNSLATTFYAVNALELGNLPASGATGSVLKRSPPGTIEKIIAPFVQDRDDRSGLGLGLSIAGQDVEADRCVLIVLDVPAMGCVFTITLPRHVLSGSALH